MMTETVRCFESFAAVENETALIQRAGDGGSLVRVETVRISLPSCGFRTVPSIIVIDRSLTVGEDK